MAMRYPGGLIATSPVNAAYPSGVWTQSQTIPYASQNVWQQDQYWRNTTLLLHGDGTNGAQNNTFLDSGTANSGSGFTITRNGNTTQGAFTPFQQNGYWSNYFDGTSAYISVPDSADFTMGSGDFTIQCWVFSTANSASDQYILGQVTSGGTASATSFQLYKKATSNVAEAYVYIGGAKLATSSATIPVGSWTHLAMVRDGGTMRLYVNGVQDGTNATLSTSSIVDSSGSFSVGRTGDYNGLYFAGYVSNVSVVKGTCLFPSGTSFTPSTVPLSASQSGQSVLLCQANRFIDSNTATTAKTVTVGNSPSVQAFQPFPGPTTWSASVLGGSGYFDGTGDNLSIANNAAFQFGSGDFTVEAWVYAPSNPPGIGSIVSHSDGASASGTQFLVRTEGGNTSVVAAVYSGGTGYVATWSSALPIGQWNHVAFTRSGTSTYLWVNGVQRATASVGSVSLNTTSTALTIGSNASASADNWLGYISGTRITKGAALYTATFTPPTAPPTTTVSSGTVGVLLNFTNAGIFDNAQMNDLETVGNAQISTSVVKYGTGSMAFDGSGDYLVGRTTDLLSFNTGDFTVEMWVYPNSVAGNIVLIDTRSSGTDSGWAFYINSSSKLALFTSNADRITAGSALSASTWTHVVLARSGSTLAIYMNGVQSATATYSTTMTCPGRISIASGFDNAAPLNGYIDDLRITKGVARYISNFTPPIARMPNQ